jgi:methionyl-tRNA formyltransferase
MVRAYHPWPGAFTFAGGKRLRIHRACPWHQLPAADVAPGTLVAAPGGVAVICNPGALHLLEVQEEGRKRQEAAEWLRGSRLAAGVRFSASV